MRATTAILALAGTALAVPHYNKPQQYKEVQNVHVVYETVVHTVYYTEGEQKPAKPTKPATPVYEAPAVTTVVYEESTPAPAPSSKVEYSEAPAPAPTSTKEPATSTASAPASTSTGTAGYQAKVDKWRAQMGLKPLVTDSKLESNAKDTVDSASGAMVHKLNPGSYGQVLAPGKSTDDGFERVFVGGWLCEIPSLPGLEGVCETASVGWAYNGQTGHAKLLTSDKYTKIGCAHYLTGIPGTETEFDGMWCCDLA